MKTLFVALFLSMLVGVATAVTCSSQCTGGCAIYKTTCDASVVFGPLCDIGFGSCSQGCAVVCGCLDGCLAQCKPAKDSCVKEASGNPLLLIQCTVQNNQCIGQCNLQCAIQSALNTVTAVLGGGSASK